VVAQAGAEDRAQLLDAIFDLSHEELVKRVHGGSLGQPALHAHEYVYDIFPNRF
jgi:hypothetical protein